ncbi:MAG: PAS domain S-box protein, partial [Calditrichaeota bacterium]
WTQDNGLKENRIFALAVDSTNRVWFADQVNGLGYLDHGQTPAYLTTAEGLSSNEVWGIYPGPQGKLWIATKAGLNLFNHGTWSKITMSNGLNNPHVWPVLPLSDKVYIGTIGGGINILNLAESHHPPPRVEVLQPYISGRNVILHWKALGYWGELQPYNIETRYRMDKGDWSNWSTARQTYLSGLNSGLHEFEVQAKSFLGNLSVPYKRDILIDPPFYRQPLFILSFAILLVFMVLLGFEFILRKNKQDELLRQSEEKYRELFENANDIIYTHDLQGNFLSINKSGEKVTGYSKEEMLKMNINQIVPLEQLKKSWLMINQRMVQPITTTYEMDILAKDGKRIPLEVSTRLIKQHGRPVAVQGIARDITERRLAEQQIKKSLDEKVVLLKEIHHRVKNNLQIISSLLNLQYLHLQDGSVHEAFKASQNRIRTIALIHEKLYQSDDLANVNFAEYIHNLANYLLSSHTYSAQNITLRINTNKIFMAVDKAIPCGLILNELLSNALKHAFPNKSADGLIEIGFRRSNGVYELKVMDNGIGMPLSIVSGSTHSLGMQLVRTLSEQINGEINIAHEKGTEIKITFPV